VPARHQHPSTLHMQQLIPCHVFACRQPSAMQTWCSTQQAPSSTAATSTS
jgi:hypothetical protein